MVGYRGHRPGADDMIGATSYGGMPYRMERTGQRSTPGMGFGKRPTTYNMEIGISYGKRKPSKNEIFAALAPGSSKPVGLDFVASGEKDYVATLAKPKVSTLERATNTQSMRAPYSKQPWEKQENKGSKSWHKAQRTLPEMHALRAMYCQGVSGAQTGPDDVYIPPWEMSLSEIYGKDTAARHGLW